MGRGATTQYYKSMNEDYVEGTLTCLRTETIKKKINTDFPLVLNIEPTNACNLRCICCPRDRTVRHHGISYLPIETFKNIIDEAAGYNKLIMLNLHKDGEPLLHEQLSEMVAYAKKKNVAKTIHLNTNGTLLDTDAGKRLLESGIDDITISVDAAFPETYRKLKRSDDFDSLNKSIEFFVKYRDKIDGDTNIRVKIMEFSQVNADEIKAFFDKWEGTVDQVQVTGAHNWSGAIKQLEVTDETSPVRYPCVLLWYMLAVNSNGKVSVCNVDWNYSGVVGNVYNKSIHNIWNDSPIRKIRQTHLNSNWTHTQVCDLCVVWVSVGDMKAYLQTIPEFT